MISPSPIPGSRWDIIIIAGIVAAGGIPEPAMPMGRVAAGAIPVPAMAMGRVAGTGQAKQELTTTPVTSFCRTDTRGLMRLPRDGKSGSGIGEGRGEAEERVRMDRARMRT